MPLTVFAEETQDESPNEIISEVPSDIPEVPQVSETDETTATENTDETDVTSVSEETSETDDSSVPEETSETSASDEATITPVPVESEVSSVTVELPPTLPDEESEETSSISLEGNESPTETELPPVLPEETDETVASVTEETPTTCDLPVSLPETEMIVTEEIFPEELEESLSEVLPPPLEYQSISSGNITVEGMLPVGAYLIVKEIPVSEAETLVGETEKVLFAYDITIMFNDKEYQPTEPVTTIINSDVSADADVKVYHISEDDINPVLAESSGNGTVEFVAESFSIYIGTVGTGANILLTSGSGYRFYSDAECTSSMSGSVQNTTSIDIYVKATDEYVINSVTVSTESGTVSSVTAVNTNGIWKMTFPTSLTENQIITVTAGRLDGTIVFDLAQGSVTLGDTYSGFDSDGYAVTGIHSDTNCYIVMQSISSATENRIVVIGNSSAPTFDVTLDNIDCSGGTNFGLQTDKDNIEHSGICVACSKNKDINLILRLIGVNRVGRLHYSTNGTTGGSSLDSTCNSSLIITSAEGDGSTEGTLYAESKVNWSAAIGGTDSPENTKNIIINGGTIYATSTSTAAIGGGGNGIADIEINGGSIIASSRGTGATIGGGGGNNLIGAEAKVTITGGSINAINYDVGTAIGAGSSPKKTGGYSEVVITGGTIIAYSAEGTAIGGGNSTVETGGDAIIDISGGNITATSNGNGAAIGSGGSLGTGISGAATITISGGIINAISNGNGTAIGTAASGSVIGGEATILITGGTIIAAAGADANGAGLGGGQLVTRDSRGQATITISGGSVNASNTTAKPLSDVSSQTIVYPYVVKVSDVSQKIQVISVNVSGTSYDYICNDMYTDEEGNLFLWLPTDSKVLSAVTQDESRNTASHSVTHIPTAVIYGSSTVGTELTAVLNDGNNSSSITAYQWQYYTGGEWCDIDDATSSTYTTKVTDIGKNIRVILNHTNISAYVSIVANTVIYYITIPETVPMQNAGTINIQATGVDGLLTGQALDVIISSENNFKLVSDDKTLSYKLSASANGASFIQNAAAISFYENGTNSLPIYYTIIDSPHYPGTYTDTLTFTITFDNGS